MQKVIESGDSMATTTMIDKIGPLRERALSALEKLQPLAYLLGRLGVGLVFLSTGWGKVHNVEKVTEFFTSLGIPAPGFHAVLVGWTELLCGAALVLGLLTRLASVPLIISMIVAILTAKRAELKGLFELVGFEEFTYIVVLSMLGILGPGRWSIDHLLAKRFEKKPKKA